MKEECTVRKHAFETRVEWTLNNVVRNKKHEAPVVAPSKEQLHIEFPR
jgi:hypothetical protein